MKKQAKTKTIVLKGGAKVTIPVKFDYDKCKCGANDIIWAETEKERNMPIRWDEDKGWISHFADCPLAGEFRK